jgi:hypothetical protein
MVIAATALLAAAGCRSEDKEKRLQEAEDAARLETEEKARRAKGVGEGLQGAGREGAQAVSKGLGAVYRGTVKGLDQGVVVVTMDFVFDERVPVAALSTFELGVVR